MYALENDPYAFAANESAAAFQTSCAETEIRDDLSKDHGCA